VCRPLVGELFAQIPRIVSEFVVRRDAPKVFTDGDSQAHAADVYCAGESGPGYEEAELIVDIVGWKVRFSDVTDLFAIMGNDTAITKARRCAVFRRQHCAKYDPESPAVIACFRGFDEALVGLSARFPKVFPKNVVGGWVAADRELWEDNDVYLGTQRFDFSKHSSDISVDVPYGCIDLTQRNSHRRTSLPTIELSLEAP